MLDILGCHLHLKNWGNFCVLIKFDMFYLCPAIRVLMGIQMFLELLNHHTSIQERYTIFKSEKASFLLSYQTAARSPAKSIPAELLMERCLHTRQKAIQPVLGIHRERGKQSVVEKEFKNCSDEERNSDTKAPLKSMRSTWTLMNMSGKDAVTTEKVIISLVHKRSWEIY